MSDCTAADCTRSAYALTVCKKHYAANRRAAAPLAQTVMSGPEVLAEVDWLFGGGVSPRLAAQTLNRTIGSLEALARNYDRADLAATFSALNSADTRERKAA